MLIVPLLPPLPLPLPDDGELAPDKVLIGFVGSLEFAARVLPRFNIVGPEFKCCRIVASFAALLGFWSLNAQMIPWETSEFAGIVKTSFGFEPDNELSDGWTVATRGGFGSTVGITSWGAFRCDSVMVPSVLGHIMTIGVLAIV